MDGRQRDTSKRGLLSCLRLPLLSGLCALALAVGVFLPEEVALIRNSTSSTAAIGYIFLPIVLLIRALPWALVGATAGFGYLALRHRRWQPTVIFFAGLTLSVAYAAHFIVSQQQEESRKAVIAEVETMDSDAIDHFLASSQYAADRFVLGAIALHPATSAAALARIAARPDPALHQAMWAAPEIMGENRKGLAVMRLVALHPNVTPQTLSMLSQSPIDYVLGSVARNPKTPASDLQSMFNAHKGMSGFYLIEWGLASNPATPGDIIEQLSLSDNEYTLRYLKTNPATPQSIKDAIPY
mgnify:FL=1